ncbi:MAG TPA: hypothetical protein VEK34_09835 [Methylocella sp.]|nr:hypothetical protein [Methylocella sp.]
MLCPKCFESLIIRGRRLLAALALMPLFALGGCGGFLGTADTPQPQASSEQGQAGGSQSRVLAMMLGFKNNDAPAAPGSQVRHIFCPQVLILEGTAASRAYAGTPQSNTNLRYQYSLTDTARECTLNGDDLAIKIGVAGKVLLGPAGAPGPFSVPVRMAILTERDNKPVTSKIYRATVNVAAGQTSADFTVVSDPLEVPFIKDHAEDDYTIKVGIDEGPEKPAPKTDAKH